MNCHVCKHPINKHSPFSLTGCTGEYQCPCTETPETIAAYALEAAERLAAIADDVNDWLKRSSYKDTAHQTQLEAALRAYQAATKPAPKQTA